MAKKTAQRHASTRVSLAPLTVDEALSALLKTPPPTKKQPEPKKARKKVKRRG
jgi:hypothetical protein